MTDDQKDLLIDVSTTAAAVLLVIWGMIIVMLWYSPAYGAQHTIVCTYPDSLTQIPALEGEITYPCGTLKPCVAEDEDKIIAWSSGEHFCNLSATSVAVPEGALCMFQFRDVARLRLWTVIPWPFCTIDGSRQPQPWMGLRDGTLGEYGWMLR